MSTIRKMRKEDLIECRDLIAASTFFQAYGIDANVLKASLEAALNNPNAELHVALVDDNVAGFSWVILKGGFDRSPYLRLLAVDDRVHRQGIGRKLMTTMEERHKDKGDLLLLVTESNDKAKQFYESLHYKQVGLLEDYVKPGVHECIYRKRIQ